MGGSSKSAFLPFCYNNVSSTKFNVFPEIRFISEIGFAELKVHIKEI